jgi:branched-chain amino acid transport system substrate-binding protein
MYVEKVRRFGRTRAVAVSAALLAAIAFAFADSGRAHAVVGHAAAKLPAASLKYPVSNFLAYTNGKAGAANPKLAPVKIGWVNNQGGQVLVGPTATNGAALAAKWINQHAGGIGGHPIQIVNCFIPNTEAEGTTCGDQLLATKGLEAIAFGGVAVGASSVEAVVSPKIPIFCGICINPSDVTNPNTYIFGGAGEAVSWPWGTFSTKVLHAKTAAEVFPNGPGFVVPAQAAAQAYKAEGIKVTSVGLDPAATDYVGALEAANVASDDTIYTNGTVSSCIAVAKALTQLNVAPTKVVSSPLCLTPAVKQALGDYPKWYYGTAQDNLDAKLPQTAAYYKLLAKYGLSASDEDPWFCTGFAEIMTAAQFMNAIGYAHLSPAAVGAQAKKWHGPFLLGQPLIRCGAYKNAPASCSYQTHFYRYEGNGVFKPASGWLEPPPSLLPK